ncbi:DUF2922 domain-containing protein [Lactobacillus corticis]|uniref:DUF2922 domain-containing protein n=1 Tax=Lactobacillus corticis TaxID=2201249 RepID=A0A916QH79_9LACO|nr:DUF2922 domain-containing protein [Lactobacillus corticis]GFZ26919.1 hypothetical protein LCB40_07990 [Lactobacillus corticis]
MTKTTKTLKLIFVNGAGKKSSLSLANARPDLDKASVMKAMDTIAQANIFAKDGVDTYQIVDSAQYIERTVTPIFDSEAKN